MICDSKGCLEDGFTGVLKAGALVFFAIRPPVFPPLPGSFPFGPSFALIRWRKNRGWESWLLERRERDFVGLYLCFWAFCSCSISVHYCLSSCCSKHLFWRCNLLFVWNDEKKSSKENSKVTSKQNTCNRLSLDEKKLKVLQQLENSDKSQVIITGELGVSESCVIRIFY